MSALQDNFVHLTKPQTLIKRNTRQSFIVLLWSLQLVQQLNVLVFPQHHNVWDECGCM